MGRPREFDKTHALDKAVKVFWSKGYEAASLTDLTGAMGISRSSFYGAYGTKQDLYLASIRRYGETVVGSIIGILESDMSGRAAIEAVLASVVESAVSDDGLKGCLLGNAAAEISPHAPWAAQRIKAGLSRLARAYYAAVVRGQTAGDISDRHDARALARYLLAGVNGLQLIGKTNPDRAILDDIAKVMVSALD